MIPTKKHLQTVYTQNMRCRKMWRLIKLLATVNKQTFGNVAYVIQDLIHFVLMGRSLGRDDTNKTAAKIGFREVNLAFRHRLLFTSSVSLAVIDYSSDLQRLWSGCRYAQLIWTFAGHTYHFVGNLMLQLKCSLELLIMPADIIREITGILLYCREYS